MDTRIALSMPDDLIAAVDEWRRQQPDIPGRSEAIRRLIDRGMLHDVHLRAIGDILRVILEISERGIMNEDDIARIGAALNRHYSAHLDMWDREDEEWRTWMAEHGRPVPDPPDPDSPPNLSSVAEKVRHLMEKGSGKPSPD